MGLSTTFSDINSLGEISFVAGSSYTIKFVLTDQSGSPIDLSEATCRWKMAPFGQNNTILDKTCSVIATNIFAVILGASDTEGISGKYTHQPEITFENGLVLKPGQGTITLIRGL